MNPVISVIMATYNTPNEWLKESINSILQQTYSDFEFIIIDDCSTTDLSSIKETCKDDRIIWIKNEENIGLTKSLNKALKIATGKYIARMDADDIALPERFAVQVEYMEKHPEVIVCGSWRCAFGAEEKDEIWNIPKTREEQQVQLFFFNCGLTHPTAMFRKSMLDQYGIQYNENYTKAQDYGIWVQCTRYAPMGLVHQVLLQYRKSQNQVTADRNSVRVYDSMVKIDQLKSLFIRASEEEMELHVLFCNGDYIKNPEQIKKWLSKLISSNNLSGYFHKKSFRNAVEDKWYDYCKRYENRSQLYALYKQKAFKMRHLVRNIIERFHVFVAKIIY